jgi:hypothetical protein
VTLGRYALLVSMIVAASLGLLLSTLLSRLDRPAQMATLAGALLAALNTVTAYALVRWSRDRSATALMGAVLGGMVGRMGALLLAVALGVLFLGLPKVPLAVSLLSYFVLFLVFELAQLQRERGDMTRAA